MRKSKLLLSKFMLVASLATVMTGGLSEGIAETPVFATTEKVTHKKSNSLKKAKRYDTTKVVKAKASSSKKNKHIIHTIDSSMDTAWEEDAPGSGIGEVLSYKFDSAIRIGKVLITNGDVSSKDNYYKKNRIAKADVKYYNGDDMVLYQQVELGDTYTKKPHHIELDRNVDVDRVDIEVTAIHQGKSKDTLAVSEVTFGNLERDNFEKTFNKLKEKWVTPTQAEEFIKYADKYADKAIAMSAVSSRTEYYRMYASRKYNYKKDFVDKLKQIYRESGASHIVSKKDLMAAFDNAARGYTIGRQENGLFVTSFAEDTVLLYNDKGKLKSASNIEEVKGVDSGKYKDGVFQYEYDADLTKNLDKLNYIRTANGDSPGASSLNIPGCQTWAGKHIENSESELIFPSIDVKGISSKDVLKEIQSKGYFEIVDPKVVAPNGKRVKVNGRFKVRQMQDRK
ncbi:NADase-type glycan-binding domain-containing protein [Streptococcus phocae]|uniref:N-acetylglucosamine-1-phosphate uridyltransferase n=1 Tax=Streptococcus phocae TaxID=119224 RepID=A0A0P6S3T3_9STRE|nr:N-acetylglucosamine-1-phosphate uridyltransferase [Streptococcus phocae]KPJ22777.1 N-acetylglucosamine-1-phosphate uridyltransferase [Streptococcus phocae]